MYIRMWVPCYQTVGHPVPADISIPLVTWIKIIWNFCHPNGLRFWWYLLKCDWNLYKINLAFHLFKTISVTCLWSQSEACSNILENADKFNLIIDAKIYIPYWWIFQWMWRLQYYCAIQNVVLLTLCSLGSYWKYYWMWFCKNIISWHSHNASNNW